MTNSEWITITVVVLVIGFVLWMRFDPDNKGKL